MKTCVGFLMFKNFVRDTKTVVQVDDVANGPLVFVFLAVA